jgi:allophanate hydrolase subunit 1
MAGAHLMKEFSIFMLGMWLGIALMATIEHLVPTSHRNTLKNAMTECEKSLPRDQHCKIIAVPVEKK